MVNGGGFLGRESLHEQGCHHPRKAKADDPVFQSVSIKPKAAAYWIPAFAGMTTVAG
jgi:hypothetical protein